MEIKIDSTRILEAANKCSTAKDTLKILFPEVFKEAEEKKGFVKAGGTPSHSQHVIAHDNNRDWMAFVADSDNAGNKSGDKIILTDRYHWMLAKTTDDRLCLIPSKKQ